MMACSTIKRGTMSAVAIAAMRPATATAASAIGATASPVALAAAAAAAVRLYSSSSTVVAARAHSSAIGAHASRRCACATCATVAHRSCISSLSTHTAAAASAAVGASVRCFSVHARKSGAHAHTPPRSAGAATPSPSSARTPTFNQVMKRFNLLVHPDLFGASPSHQHVNQESLQALNSLLSTLKSRDSKDLYPPKQVLQLVFHVKKRRGDERWAEYVRTIDLQMHLSGKGAAKAPTQQQSNSGGRRVARPARGESALPPRGKDTLEGEFHVVPVIVSTNGGHCKKQVQEQLASLFYRCGLPHKFEWDEEYWNMGGAKSKEDFVQEEEQYYEERY